MCGIFGYSLKDGRNYAPRFDLVEVLEAMKFRGPDSSMTYFDGSVGLGFNRLGIVGLKERTQQPLTTQDGRYTIVFNGEIFNSNELRTYLRNKGFVFTTETGDTEVVLAAYSLLGDDCVNLFNGMFAFVVYDSLENTLSGFVDRVGIKPLFFSDCDEGFFFSSEISSISKKIKRTYDLDYLSVFNFFRLQYIPFENTIYKGIFRLKPGEKFKYRVSSRKLDINQWNFPRDKILSKFNPDDFRKYFEDAIERWALSEVSFGVSLSDGLDSSLITTILARKGYAFNTYTLKYEIEGYDYYNELTLSKALSNKYGLKQILVGLDESILTQEIPNIFKSLTEPYSGGISSFFIYKSMREHGEKVALTGVGGDELFGNYRKWRIYYDPVNLIRQSLKNFIDEGFQNPGIFGLNYKLFTDNRQFKLLFNQEFSKAYSDYEFKSGLRTSISKLATDNLGIRDAVRSIDMALQLPYEFLIMTDRFSMYNSIEARTPFLDRDFMQQVLDYKYTDISKFNKSKSALSNVFAEYNSDLISDKPKKGFAFPDELFYKINKELIGHLLSSDFLKSQNIFNQQISKNINELNSSVYRNLVYFQLWYHYNEVEN